MFRLAKTAMLALVPLALLAVLILFSAGALPYKLYTVRTGSMGSTIPSRSAVLVRQHDYRLGQVISFRESGSVVTHRFVAENADGTIVTKGDANRTEDPWHPTRASVIGGVVAAPRMVGYWLVYLKNPVGLLSIILVALAIAQIWAIAGQADPASPDGGRQPGESSFLARRPTVTSGSIVG